MKLGFTDCSNAIVALAAISSNFLMVGKRNNVESLWRMTGLAHVTGGNVIRWLTWNRTEVIVMAIHTIRRHAFMMSTAGGVSAIVDDDRGHGALTGNAVSTHHQLQHIDTTHIGDETGRRCCGALQRGTTASRLIGEGPVIAQRTP